MNSLGLRIAAIALLLMPTGAWAGFDSGLYFGGGIGRSFLELDEADPGGGVDFEADDDDNAFKIILGYNFGITPLFDLALEGSYVDFGQIEDNSLGRFIDSEVTGVTGFGMGAVTLGIFKIFAKTGFINWDSDATLGAIEVSDSGTDTGWGLGVGFQFESLTLRAEYESFNVDGFQDLSMASASVLYTF